LSAIPDVLDYRSQPVIFSFKDESGKWRTYTPDFMVWRRDGTIEIHEVTLTERQERPGIRQREKAALWICATEGWRYIVHTERSLPQPSEVANLLALLRYRPTAYAHEQVTEALLEFLSQPMSLEDLMQCIARRLGLPEHLVFGSLCHLLWHGILETDFSTLFVTDGCISPDILVWMHKSIAKGST
jgi:TnsA-like endonuclease N terminal